MEKNVPLPRQPERRGVQKQGISHSTWVICLVVGITWAVGTGALLLSLRPYQEVKHRVRAPLKGTNLAGAKLVSAPLAGRDLSYTNLQAADLTGADLHGASLAGCNLTTATLDDADLRGASLRGANLRGAHLINANLLNADLRGADLRGADMEAMYLQGIDLTRAQYDRTTVWPHHYDPRQYGAVFVKALPAPAR